MGKKQTHFQATSPWINLQRGIKEDKRGIELTESPSLWILIWHIVNLHPFLDLTQEIKIMKAR